MATPEAPSWLDVRQPPGVAAPDSDEPGEFVRLWRGFMTARVTLGVLLLLLQAALHALGQAPDLLLIYVCGFYLLATLGTRLTVRPRRLGATFDPQWVWTIGVDVAAFAALQFVQGHSGINYTPLLALPVLLASVLGGLALAMGTAASVTLLLLAQAGLLSLRQAPDAAPLLAQTALTGAGYFVIAFLSTQVAARLASEERRSQRSRLAVRVQRQVNELVIETLNDGIMVVDGSGLVWAANPSAGRLLGREPAPAGPFSLAQDAGWSELADVVASCFGTDLGQRSAVELRHAGAGPQRVLVRTRMTATDGDSAERLCVVFLQDQRELEARMRTEKLVSMGRMSTAVAHEIRNPLAAIVQANALLDEDIADPRLKRLTQMVRQNAQRLEGIVDEILNISRVQDQRDARPRILAPLNALVARICHEWEQHTGAAIPVGTALSPADPQVAFDQEHLRRVLINLLDNARRYASERPQSIQVSTRVARSGKIVLGVWSDGQPMESSVERHLFEPFFSSESRSTGLGLYICRELCEGQGAIIGFERTRRAVDGRLFEGNEFLITMDPGGRDLSGAAPSASDRIPFTP
jgi:two-component system sensor histidine kinase PilS (NtrC family)